MNSERRKQVRERLGVLEPLSASHSSCGQPGLTPKRLAEWNPTSPRDPLGNEDFDRSAHELNNPIVSAVSSDR
ncbi:hypothetical protein [Rhodopirellula bahusiensis]|uniref:Uncharacterized protein n=1 Tax=Rhodopirellula bahusiensis TaxID=2014065 RepID=A0A2G1W1M3_9BACT|nr:hypothetical protein [Rhodopirellula bahusiensis]PHQ32926.1 hypothetical protein CEE69_23380 [Rhodopirellula bahusiensis]